MSKSLGNFIVVNDVLKDWPGEVARLSMLMTHYRQPINWTVKSLTEAQKILDGWYGALSEADATGETGEIDAGVLAALCDDLNSPKAISILHSLKDDPQALRASARLMGLLEMSAAEWAALRVVQPEIDPVEIEALIQARIDARANKDWAEADRIRDELVAKNIVLMDGPTGTEWEVKG